MNISFTKVALEHKEIIFSWLEKPHVKEFWDNSQEHRDDIIKFVNGRKEPSNYCGGLYTYWVGYIGEEPYSLIMALEEKLGYDIPPLKKEHLSKSGHTYSLDYMIGNKEYFSKGLGAKTLKVFMEFFRKEYDHLADTFLIDPVITNPRAKHVFERAGFDYIGDFIMSGDGHLAGYKTHLLVKKYDS